MSRIRGKNTSPELIVRRLLHGLGYRYRLHRKDLPGTPDIAFPGRRKVVMVHGCFWHRHLGCRYAYEPKSRKDFWARKFERNVKRDREARRALMDNGWEVMVVWECEIKDRDALARHLTDFIDAPSDLSGSRSAGS